MLRASKIVVALLLMAGAASVPLSSRLLAASDENPATGKKPTQTLKPVAATSPEIPFDNYDLRDYDPRDYDPLAERLLLYLANQARAQAGTAALTLDAGLSRAARLHAEKMRAERQVSHQFQHEASLAQRLAATTTTQLDQEGENVAFDFDVEKGHQHLMQSPPHRANLLNPAYNVVGLGVVRSGDRLYIVQDFGHALPSYSLTEVKRQIAAALAESRRQASQHALARSDLANADDTACSMAQADRLGTKTVQDLAQRYTVLTYTSLHPRTLPENAIPILSSRGLRSFSVGACYARTATYPTGVYWVVLSLD
ncbi:MAG: CAP domain-containing protein [Candidatus Sulfotelmatobacter sp.]